VGLETVIVAKSMESNIQTYKDIKTQSDAVLHFLQHLDIEMVEAMLEENSTYQGLQKKIFIEKLGLAFNEFISDGDTFLNRHVGFCNAKNCNYKYTGYRFIGNNSADYFDILIEIENGVVIDICECSFFKCNKKVNCLENKLIEIDKL
jgi:hypothetical protein